MASSPSPDSPLLTEKTGELTGLSAPPYSTFPAPGSPPGALVGFGFLWGERGRGLWA